MTIRMIRVFVNGSGVDLAAGASARDAVEAWSESAAGEVGAGQQIITDSRGLPIDAATPMSAGSILRLVPRRVRGDASAEPGAE